MRYSWNFIVGCVVFSLAVAFYCLDFFFRISPSLVLGELMRQYHITALGVGFFASSFYFGYVLMQIPSGIIFDRYGFMRSMLLGLFVCTCSYILFVITTNELFGVILRFVIGAGSAFSFIGALYFAKNYFSAKYFGLLTGITISFGTLAASLAQYFATYLLRDYSWHESLIIIAIFGFVVMFILFILLPFVQDIKTSVNSGYKFIFNKKLLFNGIRGGLFYLPTSIFASTWGISFLEKQFHMSRAMSSFAIFLIFLGWALGSPLVGFYADKFNCSRVFVKYGAIAAAAVAFLLIYVEQLPLYLIYCLVLLFGLVSSFQVAVWNEYNKLTNNVNSGQGIAFTNMIIMLVPAIVQIIFAFIMNLAHGHLVLRHTANYNLHDYHLALMLLPLAFLSSGLFFNYKLQLED